MTPGMLLKVWPQRAAVTLAWARILEAISEAYEGDIQMIDSSSIRVHQHAANGQKKPSDPFSGSLGPMAFALEPWAVRAAA